MPTHRVWARVLVLVLVAAGASACGDRSPVAPRATAPRLERVGGGGWSSRHVIVMREGSGSVNDLAAAVRALGARVVRVHDAIGVLTVAGLTDEGAARLRDRGDVDGIRRDVMVRMIPPMQIAEVRYLRAESDQHGAQFFPLQWNLRQIKADQAWLVTQQGEGALVCILDTGIDPNHIDLAGRVDLGISTSFVETEPDILDRNLHGTFVAALIASNGLGMASVAPEARLCAVKVLDRTGMGSFSDVIAGIVYAASHGADVINMSLGAYFPVQTRDDVQLVAALQRAIAFAIRRGALPVAAAGNDTVNLATDPPRFISVPAQLAGVLSVGATGPIAQQDFDRIAGYSNVGFPGVDVFAPGGEFDPPRTVLADLILSACSGLIAPCAGGNAYVLADGTSAAAPHVAGEAAVIESIIRRDQRAARLESCIRLTSDHPTGRFIDPLYGFGRINVLRAAICGRGG
jgi:subtilisin family serine protease